jgi:hypothetical protein
MGRGRRVEGSQRVKVVKVMKVMKVMKVVEANAAA